MSTLLNLKSFRPVAIQEKIRELGITIFTPGEFKRFFGMSSANAKYLLETYTKRGVLVRLKRGLYALKNNLPSEEIIANVLYKPSYISLEYALAKYGIIPEMPYVVTSVTTKATASFTVQGKEFSYTKIKGKAFGGYTADTADGHTFFIAEPEKALVDYLYFVSLGKKSQNDRLDVSRLAKKKARDYAVLFDRPSLMSIVNTLFEH